MIDLVENLEILVTLTVVNCGLLAFIACLIIIFIYHSTPTPPDRDNCRK